jgi:hypothetical protein
MDGPHHPFENRDKYMVMFIPRFNTNGPSGARGARAVRGILAEIASFSIKYEPEIIFVDKKPRNNMKELFGTGILSEVYDF